MNTNNTLRITGYVSGLDTDSIVESLMRVERLKVTSLERNKQLALWKQEAYTNMNKTFANFIINTKKYMGLTKTTSTGLSFSNAYTNIDYIRKATSSNESVASVTVTSKAMNGNFNIEVKQLATSGAITSAKLTDAYVVDGMKFRLKGTKDGEYVTITVNGSTMDDVVKAINAKKSETNVYAFYDKENQILFLQSTATGENSVINLSRVSGEEGDTGYEFLQKLRGEGFTKINGQNAEIVYNGVSLYYSSNNINFNGLSIELKSVGKTSISVSTNVDGIIEKIEQLINDYNDLIDKISQAINEKRYSNYYPLSDEEKQAMKDKDIELWEEKAKSGLLNRDDILTRTLSSIRRNLYEKVDGLDKDYDALFKIGITTKSYVYGTTGGKLQIDKDKLRAAIEKNPEEVMALLFKESDNEKEKGIFTRIYDSLTEGIKSIVNKAGTGNDADLLRSVKSNILIDFVTSKSSISDLDREVLNLNNRISYLNVLLFEKEEAYYQKFANLETMLQKMYSQSSWLSLQFSGN